MDTEKLNNGSDSDILYVVTKEEVHKQMNNERLLGLLPVFILVVIIFVRIFFVIFKNKGQKTRSQQQRRAFTGSRTGTSLSQSEPTIYVSPSNLPPPPKYEAMAPPSYEEVVGIHYPQYQIPVQPITQPITTALAQSSYSTPDNATSVNAASVNSTSVNTNSDIRNEGDNAQSTVITVTTDETRTSVTVASS